MKLQTFFTRILFPQGFSCIVCGREHAEGNGHGLCAECAGAMPELTGLACRRCGTRTRDGNLCANCAELSPSFERVIACYEYAGDVRRMVISAKDGREGYLYRYFARILADKYAADGESADIVTFVPSDAGSIKERDAEVNAEFAECFANIVGMPHVKALLRTAKPADQTAQNRRERLANIRGNFVARKKAEDKIRGKRVLLLDDMITTGATAGECARVLKNDMGAESVVICVFARVQL